MSAYGAGRMAEGVMKIAFWVIVAVAIIVGVFGFMGAWIGPLASAGVAAIVVYVIASIITFHPISVSGMRYGTVPGAALAAYIGASVAVAMGGWGGAITGALITGVLAAVLMTVLGLLAQSVYEKITGKKAKAREEASKPTPPSK